VGRLTAATLRHHVEQRATKGWILVMAAQPEVTQRDLRNRSKEIMDAVESGRSFTVTGDGHEIGELIPLRRRRSLVARAEFVAMSRNAAQVDIDAFRADQEAALDQEPRNPYGQWLARARSARHQHSDVAPLDRPR